MDELQRLEDWVTPLLGKLSASEQRALARTIARELRADNAQQMRSQQAPDGTKWEPRKPSGLRSGRGQPGQQGEGKRGDDGQRAKGHQAWTCEGGWQGSRAGCAGATRRSHECACHRIESGDIHT